MTMDHEMSRSRGRSSIYWDESLTFLVAKRNFDARRERTKGQETRLSSLGPVVMGEDELPQMVVLGMYRSLRPIRPRYPVHMYLENRTRTLRYLSRVSIRLATVIYHVG